MTDTQDKDAIIRDLLTALVHTAEYIGQKQLPAVAGWSWWDALVKYGGSEYTEPFTNPPILEASIEELPTHDSSEENNLVTHARRELTLLGEYSDVIEWYISVIESYASFGHSGGSTAATLPVLNKLLCFENLMPITSNPGEWEHITEAMAGRPDLWQSSRNSKLFSNDGGKTWYNVDDTPTVLEPEKVANVSLDVTNLPVDRKYGWVLTENGEFEDNEPVFVFRARDEFLPFMLGYYVSMCRSKKTPERHINGILQSRSRIINWQAAHPDKVKRPDSEASREWME